MKNIIIKIGCILCCISLLFNNIYTVYASTNSQDSQFSNIDKFVKAEMKAIRIPGLSLGIVKGNKIIYLKGYGTSDTKGTIMSPTTPVVLGSITKTITALAIRQLINEGKMDESAPVTKYIPWFRTADKKNSDLITIGALLNHTSGFTTSQGNEFAIKNLDVPLENRIRNLSKIKLGNVPGMTAYCNINYAILGLVIEKVSGENYSDYIQKHIFKELDMKNSFVLDKNKNIRNLAVGHKIGFGFPIADHLKISLAGIPAGYIASSAEDMCNYIRVYLNKGVYKGSRITQQRKLLNPEENYNIYWKSLFIQDVIEHGGATPDYNTDMLIDYSKGYGVIVLANSRNDLVANAYHISQNIMYILDGYGIGKVASDDKFNQIYKIVDILALLILILFILHFIQFVLLIKGIYHKKKLKVRNILSFILIDCILPIVVIVGVPLYIDNIYINGISGGIAKQNFHFGWNDLLYVQGIDLTYIFIISILLLCIGIMKALCMILSRYRTKNKLHDSEVKQS